MMTMAQRVKVTMAKPAPGRSLQPGHDFAIEEESGQAGQNDRRDGDTERRHDRLGGNGHGAHFQRGVHQRLARQLQGRDQAVDAQRDEHHADDGKQRRERREPSAAAPDPRRARSGATEQRRGKKRKRRAVERNGRRSEDQAESKDAAHARRAANCRVP